MFTKEDVIKISKEHFLTNGYQVQEADYLMVTIDEVEYRVFALGTVNDHNGSSKIGRSFNKNQIKSLLGLCLFDIVAFNKACKLILPDTKLFRKQFELIKSGLSHLPVESYYISEVGIIFPAIK